MEEQDAAKPEFGTNADAFHVQAKVRSCQTEIFIPPRGSIASRSTCVLGNSARVAIVSSYRNNLSGYCPCYLRGGAKWCPGRICTRSSGPQIHMLISITV